MLALTRRKRRCADALPTGTNQVDHVRHASPHKTLSTVQTPYNDLWHILTIHLYRFRARYRSHEISCSWVPISLGGRRSDGVFAIDDRCLIGKGARAPSSYDVFCCCRVWESKLSEGLNIKGHVSTGGRAAHPLTLPSCCVLSVFVKFSTY